MRFNCNRLILPLTIVLSFCCASNVFGQTKNNTTVITQTKSKPAAKSKTKPKVKSKSSNKTTKSKPLKYMGKEFKKAVKDVGKEI